MSYDLAVWEGERPAGDAAAGGEFERLSLDDPSGTLGTITIAYRTAYADLGVTATELPLSGLWSRAQRAASS